MTFTERIVAATDTCDDAICAIARDVRASLVIPACKKYKLTFISEMGEYFFSPKHGTHYFGDCEEAVMAGYSYDMDDVFEALEIDVNRETVLGHWIDSYPKGTKC